MSPFSVKNYLIPTLVMYVLSVLDLAYLNAVLGLHLVELINLKLHQNT